MNNIELENKINKKLNFTNIQDYACNGLQVEGVKHIKNIITGVSICKDLLNIAITSQVEAIIVHHGIFWKNNTFMIKGMQKNRLYALLKNNINLYSWHLPLDINPNISNNFYLSKILDINIMGNINPFVLYGCLTKHMNIHDFIQKITKKLNRIPLHFNFNAKKNIKTIAWCSGAGQKFFEEAAYFGVDVFLTGEVSEMNLHIAKEYGIHFISAGHHATEKGGIIMLGQWLQKKYKLNINFIDIDNPI
ncbi:Nif3-like dinuclear metal center hexameric protein [Enterobacteriaceae endosymbiont of Macroplea appendiculata]|uniref:Nif3-like dinuclear metal center hexameric protein n=1 Tax=Enterobacteriaceae endosymbiont of Macroplea appendiculata TaxID=2675790 RepID=UPI001448CFA6|nr:Nif3-like dinuclear metal center hexameric protein [Enterobacteriaceae endosymbiont of Macroplea appendiculata]QJC31046.1 Nif3-like dinuclear metal center hexameric protein [Enterobacteriaceae endosymbiont of Macroplea appendiculata]